MVRSGKSRLATSGLILAPFDGQKGALLVLALWRNWILLLTRLFPAQTVLHLEAAVEIVCEEETR